MSDSEDDFSTRKYWDKKYSEKTTIFEWLENYETLRPFINANISRDSKILLPGCGNSRLGPDLYNDGYHNIDNVDFSPVVIEQMKELFKDIPMNWLVIDIKNMDYPDNTFDVVFDKGTLDALTCGEDYETNMKIAVSEYTRVVKPGGYIYIVSFGQAADRLCYFNPDSEHSWIYEKFELLPREFAPHSYYHIYILRKPENVQ